MQDSKKHQPDRSKRDLLKTLEAVFQPLATLLVEHGISSPEAERLLRAVCIREVARGDAAHGNKPNASRVALVTGVDRGDVTRILKGQSSNGDTPGGRHRVDKVLSGWHSDASYSSGGRPRTLPIRLENYKERSFWTLARRYAPGVYPGLILSELLRIGAVETVEEGSVRVRAKQFRALEFSSESVNELGARVRDLMQTILNNATEASWPRVCRTVEITDIDPRFLPLIRKMLADRSEAALAGVQEELRSNRWKRTDPNRRGVRVGLTVYTYEEEQPEKVNEKGKRAHAPAASRRRPGRRSKEEDRS